MEDPWWSSLNKGEGDWEARPGRRRGEAHGHPPKDPMAEACLHRPGVSGRGLRRGDHSEIGRGFCSVEGHSVEVTTGADLVI